MPCPLLSGFLVSLSLPLHYLRKCHVDIDILANNNHIHIHPIICSCVNDDDDDDDVVCGGGGESCRETLKRTKVVLL